MPEEIVSFFKGFREKIYSFFHHRQDATMELVDSLSSNTEARSVVQLSLNPLHRRNYCSITRVLDEFNHKDEANNQEQNTKLTQLLSENCLSQQRRRYHLFVTDCTPQPRIFSPTMKDRSYVYAANAVSGVKPVTIGHKYSVAAYLPEKKSEDTPPWLIPLSCERVKSDEKGNLIGMKQIASCIESQTSFIQSLCVSVGDCEYSQPPCLWEAKKNLNQVHISRARNNRNFYHPFIENNQEKKRGRPKQYGEAHKLHDENTWEKADDCIEFELKNKKGEPRIIKIESWQELIMRGKKDWKLSDYPFRLLRVRVYKSSGELLFARPLWLIATGKRRHELSLREIFDAYRFRYDIEHFFRFGKQRLLMDKAQTPDVKHEEAWWKLNMISYAQLYLARQIAHNTPHPWERNLPSFQKLSSEKSPTQVQKDFNRIISEIGTPAKPPKLRKKSSGRQIGEAQTKRQRYEVVIKGKKSANIAEMRV